MPFTIYHFGFLLISFLGLFTIFKEGKKYNYVLLVLVTGVMILFAGLRENSPDQISYSNIFQKSASITEIIFGNFNYENLYGEWGFLFLCSLIKTFTSNDIIFFVIFASLVVFFIAKSCRILSPYPLISILCYYSWFYSSNFGSLRHALSSALILFFISALAYGQKKIAAASLISTMFIHTASIPSFILYFYKILIRWRVLMVSFFIFSFFIALSGGVAKDTINLLIPYVNDYYRGKFEYYLQSNMWGIQEGLGRGVVIKQTLIIVFGFIYLDILKNKFHSFSILYVAYILSTLILLLFVDLKIVSNRLSNLLSVSEIILIPMLLSLVPDKQKVLIYIPLFLALLYQMNLQIGIQYYPYEFVL